MKWEIKLGSLVGGAVREGKILLHLRIDGGVECLELELQFARASARATLFDVREVWQREVLLVYTPAWVLPDLFRECSALGVHGLLLLV